MMRMNLMIYNELKELNSQLATISNSNIFSVPNGYFDSLATQILWAVHNEPQLKGLDSNVPDGYFESLADVIMNRIKLEDESALLLETIEKRNVFTVPAGYFDTLIENIKDKLQQQPARVVEMKSRSFIFKYVAAACISGIIGLSVFSVFDKKTGNDSIVVTEPDVFETAKQILKTNSFDKMMESLGDEEIESYLQSNGEDVNATLVASLADEEALPNEEDYYLDDETLDNFLKEQNITAPGSN